jgi:SAM-dependent methyltransferase
MNLNNSYSGLRSELFDLLQGNKLLGDELFYRQKLEENLGLSLEVASGSGRLLIPYLQAGLNVEGVDSSASMLEICRQKAQAVGLSPNLYQQEMQNLNLPQQYRNIYIPFFSFQFIYIWEESLEALRCLHSLLESNGQLLIALYVPREDLAAVHKNVWQNRRTTTRHSDGATVLCHRAGNYDLVEQVETDYYRYEIYETGRLVDTQLQVVKVRCYGKYEFKLMLEIVGFKNIFVYGDYTDSEVSDLHSTMIFSAWKA